MWPLKPIAAIFAIAISALAACGPAPSTPSELVVAIRTWGPDPSSETPPPCPAGQLQGELVADEVDGLAVLLDTGERVAVIWPHGYAARVNEGTLELMDETGETVAREGDHIEVGGGEYGEDSDASWRACDRPNVVAPSPAA